MDFQEDLKNSLRILREGGTILYPTDTLWGLGCDATNSSAVQKIFSIKSRDESKSLIILVNGLSMLERCVKDVPEIVYNLTSVSDSPLTIIYPEGRNLAEGVCAEDGSVGIRICNDEFCVELIERFRKPVVSTSANMAGKKSPSSFREIDEYIIRSADYTVKYRREDQQKYSASPVIKVEKNGVFKILRK
ncbi:MAG: L-threonylcarbamoyladenylate synthase [Bacteroidia bacterium]|nr:L-threonylcarbamoyladenylate synthase [Bacteroidia bacterium]